MEITGQLGRALIVACAAMLVAACGPGSVSPAGSPTPARSGVATSPEPAPSGPATAAASATPSSSADGWAADLDLLDREVRRLHPSPFAVHSEAEWKARLAEIVPLLAAASPDERLVLVASLVGLLDTHSGVGQGGVDAYELLFYKFSDGWFVVAAEDASLVGSRLISIGGHPVEEVEAKLRPLVPHDNESGFLYNVESLLTNVKYLRGAGIVSDWKQPQYVLELPDGTRRTVDPRAVDEGIAYEELGVLGALVGHAPEAVARRGERIWTRIDGAHRVFLISVNDYGDMQAAGDAMTQALDAGQVDRVVLDARYLQGGSGDIAILDTLRDDPRVNKPGGLTALIGRENVSAGTQVAYYLDTETDALLVGEATPARAGNFTCPCEDISLPHLGLVVTVPTYWDVRTDPRPEIAPDVPMALSSKDFFAGRDPVLDAALAGLAP